MADQGGAGPSIAALARLRAKAAAVRARRGSEQQSSTPSYLNSYSLSAVVTAKELQPTAGDAQTTAAPSPQPTAISPMGQSASTRSVDLDSELPSLANFASFRSMRVDTATETSLVREPSLVRRQDSGGAATTSSGDNGTGEGRASLSQLGESLKRSLNGGVPKVGLGDRRLSVSSIASLEGASTRVANEEPEGPEGTEGDEAAEHAPLEILFVDDCRIQRKVVPRLLEPLGITVNTVASGEECIEWLEERFNTSGPASFPVVILQDLHMPTPMSGRDTAKAFRKKFPDLPTPIIAYTADDDESIIPGLLEDGFTDYVAKMPGCRGLKARLQVRVLYAPSPRLVKTFSDMRIREGDETGTASNTTAAAAAAAVARADAAQGGASSSTNTSPAPPSTGTEDANASAKDANASPKARASPGRTYSFSTAPAAATSDEPVLPEVLLVDDDAIQRAVVPKVLSKIGVKVTAIESGDSVLMMLRARHKRKGPESFPALIILDLHMPGMSGVETARAIRERFPEIQIPIIAFTGDEDESIVPALMDAGFSDYVAKLPQCRGLRARIQVQLHLIEIEKRTAALVGKDERLKDVLPSNVLNNIRHGSQAFESVSILFVVMHRFTEILDEIGDAQFAAVNAAAFAKLCKIADKRSLHCKEEEGGIYMVVGGCNEATKKDHTNRIIETASEMLSSTVKLPGGRRLRFQVGIHTGSAHAGIVGVKNQMFRFFGDTVSIARHIAEHGYPDCLNVSAVTHRVHMCLPLEKQTALSETVHSVIIIRSWN